MATKLTDKQMRAKFLKVLEANEGEATAAEMVEGTGFDKGAVNQLAKALVKEKIIVPAPGGKIALPPEEEEEAPAPKAKGKVAVPAGKKGKVVAPPIEEDEDEDEDADSNELDGEEEEDAEFDSFEEDEEGTDEGEDIEDEVVDTPTPKKAKKGDVSLAAPHQQFSMAFRPIDTLDDEELTERIETATSAAESLNEQGHELVSEMLMRAVAKARRQLSKRQ